MAALPLIVFGVNETLLDLETMESTFERIFGEKSAMRHGWLGEPVTAREGVSVARGAP